MHGNICNTIIIFTQTYFSHHPQTLFNGRLGLSRTAYHTKDKEKKMKTSVVGICVAMSCGMLIAGGCAKQQVVKKDESIPPVTAPAAPAKKETAMPAQPLKQAPVAQETASQTAQKSAEIKASLEKIYFDFNSAALSGAARTTLTKNFDMLKQKAAVKVRIEGNCDERGSDEYNLALGERRAKSAEQYLITLGIPASRLSVISYGKEKPAVKGHDEAAWAKNRRDEFVIQ